MATIDVINSFPALSTAPAMLVPDELTVSEAAAILCLPEGGVVELLNSEIIDGRYLGHQRLVQRDSLLDYDTRTKRGHAILAQMIQESQEMGLYDD